MTDDFKKKNHFSVPENYFDDFNKKMMQRAQSVSTSVQSEQKPRKKRILLPAVAASIAFFAISISLFNYFKPISEQTDEVQYFAEMQYASDDVDEDYYLFLEDEVDEVDYLDFLVEEFN